MSLPLAGTAELRHAIADKHLMDCHKPHALTYIYVFSFSLLPPQPKVMGGYVSAHVIHIYTYTGMLTISWRQFKSNF